MGLSRPLVRLIARHIPKGGSLLTFGRNGIDASERDITRILREEGITPASCDTQTDSLTQFGSTIDQESVFKLMGFSEVISLDALPDEQPTLLHNLNEPLPSEHWNRYDLVLDSGTSEHCFDVKTVFSNAAQAVKVGGFICHILPMSGWVDHGFFCFSPVSIKTFYESNGFSSLEVKIIFWSGLGAMRSFDYESKSTLIANFPHRSLVFYVGRKDFATSIRTPIQPIYSATKKPTKGELAIRLLGHSMAMMLYLRGLSLLRLVRLRSRRVKD
jgi:hypothetical protein